MMVSFFLTFLSGFFTLFGLFPLLFHYKYQDKFISICLAFAAGVMICMSIIDLIPEGLKFLFEKFSYFDSFFICFIFIIFGFILSSLISYFVHCNQNQNQLFRVGIISMMGIILHNIPEGIITFISSTTNISLGISMATAIGCHNIPEGISIGIPVYYATYSKKKAFFYTLFSSLSEPFGAIITYLFLLPYIDSFVLGGLFSVTAGIMIYISLFELIPAFCQYPYFKECIISFIVGKLFILFQIIIF